LEKAGAALRTSGRSHPEPCVGCPITHAARFEHLRRRPAFTSERKG
jgi:hypothetical protein